MMKLRFDFVSNSSSSSFIVAINQEYSIDQFSKDLSRKCIEKRDRGKLKWILDHNIRTLQFCLNAYVLAYIGEIDLGDEELVYGKSDVRQRIKTRMIEDAYKKKQPLCRTELTKQTNDQWKILSTISASALSKSYYDKKTKKFHEFVTHHCGYIVVTAESMTYDFGRYHFHDEDPSIRDSDNDEKNVKQRVKYILELARNYEQNRRLCPMTLVDNIDIYKITKDTIQNTRDLINNDVKVLFKQKWQDLDALEKRLDKGEQIFRIRIAYEGDGVGSYYIYDNNEMNGLDELAVEIISSCAS